VTRRNLDSMTSPRTRPEPVPEADEYDRFEDLAKKLVGVSKVDLDKARADEKAKKPA
jgi:hypothetical protein